MTDIHQLHTDYVPFEQIAAQTKLSDGVLLYHVRCLSCLAILGEVIYKKPHTIESLERRITALEEKLND